jgi:hypothetical protein
VRTERREKMHVNAEETRQFEEDREDCEKERLRDGEKCMVGEGEKA